MAHDTHSVSSWRDSTRFTTLFPTPSEHFALVVSTGKRARAKSLIPTYIALIALHDHVSTLAGDDVRRAYDAFDVEWLDLFGSKAIRTQHAIYAFEHLCDPSIHEQSKHTPNRSDRNYTERIFLPAAIVHANMLDPDRPYATENTWQCAALGSAPHDSITAAIEQFCAPLRKDGTLSVIPSEDDYDSHPYLYSPIGAQLVYAFLSHVETGSEEWLALLAFTAINIKKRGDMVPASIAECDFLLSHFDRAREFLCAPTPTSKDRCSNALLATVARLVCAQRERVDFEWDILWVTELLSDSFQIVTSFVHHTRARIQRRARENAARERPTSLVEDIFNPIKNALSTFGSTPKGELDGQLVDAALDREPKVDAQFGAELSSYLALREKLTDRLAWASTVGNGGDGLGIFRVSFTPSAIERTAVRIAIYWSSMILANVNAIDAIDAQIDARIRSVARSAAHLLHTTAHPIRVARIALPLALSSVHEHLGKEQRRIELRDGARFDPALLFAQTGLDQEWRVCWQLMRARVELDFAWLAERQTDDEPADDPPVQLIDLNEGHSTSSNLHFRSRR